MRAKLQGYLRTDGRKGVRNNLLVVYLVECSRHVAERVSQAFDGDGVQLIGFSGCFPNEYSNRMLQRLCTHPNVGGGASGFLGLRGF